MARPISASTARNPKAIRVSRRSFVLTDSTRALDSSLVIAALMAGRWPVMGVEEYLSRDWR